jgi:hypothetical protein
MSHIGQYPTGAVVPGTIDQFTVDGGVVVTPDVLDNVNILGGTLINVDGSVANTITINYTGGQGITWSIVTIDTAMASGHGYLSNRAGTVNFTLPVLPVIGDVIRLGANIGATLAGHYWQLNVAGTQLIRVGNLSTTAGGYLRATAPAGVIPQCAIELVCYVAGVNSEWVSVSQVGNIIVA